MGLRSLSGSHDPSSHSFLQLLCYVSLLLDQNQFLESFLCLVHIMRFYLYLLRLAVLNLVDFQKWLWLGVDGILISKRGHGLWVGLVRSVKLASVGLS